MQLRDPLGRYCQIRIIWPLSDTAAALWWSKAEILLCHAMPARPDAVATARRNADPPPPSHKRTCGLMRLTAGTSCTKNVFIYLFSCTGTPSEAGTRAIRGDSIHFPALVRLDWQEDTWETRGGGVSSGTGEGGKGVFLLVLRVVKGVETFSTAATANNNNYALIRGVMRRRKGVLWNFKEGSAEEFSQEARKPPKAAIVAHADSAEANLALLRLLISCT